MRGRSMRQLLPALDPPRKPRLDAADGGLTIPATQREACMFKWLSRLDDFFPIRYSVWALCAIGLVASAAAWYRIGTSLWLVALFLGLVLLGLRDVWQSQHSVLRNYPVIGHLRFLLEFIRPEIR